LAEWADGKTMKAILCIAVYLALVCALAIVMALPTPQNNGAAETGDEDF
jgi:uncharacterized membrane protein